MTFNVFEAINEVQEILNALEEYQQIEEASKLTAFFNKLTGKKGLHAPQSAKQVKQILKRKDSQISQANSNVKAASSNLNSAGKKVIKAHNKMLDTRAEMENTLPQEHKRVLKSLKGSHDGLTQGNLKSLTKDYDKNTGEEAIKKAQKVVNNYKTAVANKKQAASNLETAKAQRASNKEGADRIFNAAVRYKANQVKKNVADAKNHVGGYIKNFHESVMELREEFSDLFEDIHTAIDKRYPKDSEESKYLHKEAESAKERVKQAEMNKDLGKYTPKKKPEIKDIFSMSDIYFDPDEEDRIEKETKWETKRHFKPMSKDEVGKHDNYIRQFGTADQEEIVKAKVARRALGKRKAKNIKEQLEELRESFPSIFEGSQKEVNKVKKEKKNDKNEPVEVVSVADELFPREGNAKQQYNQKVLDIINGMIEGTNTLEDLIQFVRKQKVLGVKEELEENIFLMKGLLEQLEEISEVSTKFTGPRLEAGKEKLDQMQAETDKIIADPNKSEEEKKEALKHLRKYICKAENTTNKATDYHDAQFKKN